VEILPISLKLQQQRCLIVGGGHIAYRKALLLVKAGAILDVIAPDIDDQLKRLIEQSKGSLQLKVFEDSDLNQAYRLVIAATNDAAVNQRVFEQAELRNLLVNSVDDIPNCRFMMPAIIDRSPLVISVASNGASPVLSRQLRTQIETLVPHGMGKLAEFSDSGVAALRPRLSIQMSVVFFGKNCMPVRSKNRCFMTIWKPPIK